MAKPRKKIKEVAKFGGIDELGKANLNGHSHDVSSLETMSETRLEDDLGRGQTAVIRCFEFGINPVAFQKARAAGMQVSKQDLFNAHHKGIELELWKDGLKVMPDVQPTVLVNEKAMKYKIFVGARPYKGHSMSQRTQTLSQIAHG